MYGSNRSPVVRNPNPQNFAEKRRTDLIGESNRPPPSKFIRRKKTVSSTKPNPDSLQVNQQLVSMQKKDDSDFDCIFPCDLLVIHLNDVNIVLNNKNDLCWLFALHDLQHRSCIKYHLLPCLNSLLLCRKFTSSQNRLQN